MPAKIKTPKALFTDQKYCPGCGHGIIIRQICEVLEEMDLDKKTILVMPVGCSCLMSDFVGLDIIQCPHGRAPAVGVGIKKVRPECTVITYQGDGDAAAIGMAETIHTAGRNNNITSIFVNNGVFGMTGGQMAPTTLVGQKTTTSPFGRNPEFTGMPMKVAELINNFDVAYVTRSSVSSAKEVTKTKKHIEKAIKAQVNNEGYSFVEILSPCPTNWGMDPLTSIKRIEEEVIPYYPLGVLQEKGERNNV
jgi:2-oxoglutarate/2-oxoacid ferredoxin oxidoreductase subunit beta